MVDQVSIINSILKPKESGPLTDFILAFDSLGHAPLLYYLPMDAINQLHYIATSAKYSGKLTVKKKMFDKILEQYGFKRYHCGTNRIVYTYPEDHSFVLKVALDSVGITDNPKEWYNQQFLKPFVCKVFDVSPCGTVALVEKVQPITSTAEFVNVSDIVFRIITKFIIGKYVMEDIGTKYFMNWGTRAGFGPVLLDYPYLFKLDGNKLYCNNVHPITGVPCDGEIDYNIGFNHLVCNKCGKLYYACNLSEDLKNNKIFKSDIGGLPMKIQIVKGDKVIKTSEYAADYVVPKVVQQRTEEVGNLRVQIVRQTIEDGEVTSSKPIAANEEFYDDVRRTTKRDKVGRFVSTKTDEEGKPIISSEIVKKEVFKKGKKPNKTPAKPVSKDEPIAKEEPKPAPEVIETPVEEPVVEEVKEEPVVEVNEGLSSEPETTEDGADETETAVETEEDEDLVDAASLMAQIDSSMAENIADVMTEDGGRV